VCLSLEYSASIRVSSGGNIQSSYNRAFVLKLKDTCNCQEITIKVRIFSILDNVSF
jgi:hypothetical protein